MAYTEAQKKATLKYKKATYKRIPLDIRIEDYEKLKEYCNRNGETVNGFLKKYILKTIKDY